ncbi:protein FAR1-RELATED SEQUENCE 5-like [Arachis ipaensis]|uniref:protein FAR1-RELATED SEQUENCE 5-like n=1 Tax=Arachis ipaensis TaxID=130454 RepID=UPI0007AF8BD7|nr:protein FAR1-RELATED SEQUENCE 5-like [Arachis ipaensis]
MWYVSRFIEEHNHELLLSKFVEYLRSHRKISDFEKAQLNSMRKIGIIIPKIYESFAAQVGGFNMVSFTKQDRPSKQLCDLFWSDGASQEDYRIFGDVLAFDATYGRNKYNLPVVFSGVNHHNQTCVFGAAMVSHESQESYNWVLERFLECMKGKTPNAIITNGDPAM